MNMRLCTILLCVAGLSFAGQTISFRWDDMEIVVLQERESFMPNRIFHGAPPDEIKAAVPDGQSKSSINAFVVKTPKYVYLIDTGMTTEALFSNLKAADIKPEEIDVILITHMHSDHIGGLLHEGEAAFMNATLHIAKNEFNYWRQANPNIKLITNAYRKKIELFTYGEDLPIVRKEMTELEKAIAMQRNQELPRIILMTDETFQGMEASGHTPGHTVFENKKLIFFGDLIHSSALQFADPNICAQFDMDMPKAVQSRRKFFDRAANSKKLVLGAHLPFPGIGYVLKDEGGHYSFKPLELKPEDIIKKTK